MTLDTPGRTERSTGRTGGLTEAGLKRAYGKIPTSVAMISAVSGGEPVGMTVGSLASASLDPPLVAFFALEESATAAAVLAAGRFQVNLLAAGQEEECFIYASRSRLAERFAQGTWTWSPSGLPRLNGCVLWMECELADHFRVGDHIMVVGQVTFVQEGGPQVTPLIFYRSKVGELDPRHLLQSQPHDFEWSQT